MIFKDWQSACHKAVHLMHSVSLCGRTLKEACFTNLSYKSSADHSRLHVIHLLHLAEDTPPCWLGKQTVSIWHLIGCIRLLQIWLISLFRWRCSSFPEIELCIEGVCFRAQQLQLGTQRVGLCQPNPHSDVRVRQNCQGYTRFLQISDSSLQAKTGPEAQVAECHGRMQKTLKQHSLCKQVTQLCFLSTSYCSKN